MNGCNGLYCSVYAFCSSQVQVKLQNTLLSCKRLLFQLQTIFIACHKMSLMYMLWPSNYQGHQLPEWGFQSRHNDLHQWVGCMVFCVWVLQNRFHTECYFKMLENWLTLCWPLKFSVILRSLFRGFVISVNSGTNLYQ